MKPSGELVKYFKLMFEKYAIDGYYSQSDYAQKAQLLNEQDLVNDQSKGLIASLPRMMINASLRPR